MPITGEKSLQSNKNTPKGGTLKERILAVSAKLFTERGYANTSVEDITRQAGCAKGSVYTYFSGKEQIFQEVSINGISVLLDRSVKALEENGTVSENLTRWAASIADMFIRYFDLAAFIMSSAANGIDESTLNAVHAKKDSCIQAQADYFKRHNLFNAERDYVLVVNGFLGYAFEFTRAALAADYAPQKICDEVARAALALFSE